MKDRYFVLLFVGFLTICGVASMIKEDVVYSQKENRLYAQSPIFSMESFFDATFMKGIETYVEDQFVLRDAWLDLKFVSERILGKKENNGILFGKDNYMMKIESYEEREDVVQAMERFAYKYQASLYLVPTSSYLLDDYLPPFAHDIQQKEQFAKLKQKDWIVRLDDVLRTHLDEEIFYRSDHHLTTLGQYYVYETWAKQHGFSTSMPAFESVSSSFLGSYARASSNPFAEKDSISILKDQDQYIEFIVHDEQQKVDSYYNKAYLGKQDEYAMFLDGNHGISEITTTIKNGKQLYIFKDSYGNAFIPFLLPHYEHITVIDLRFYQDRVSQLLEQDEDYDIMMMYALHNIDETMLKLLR